MWKYFEQQSFYLEEDEFASHCQAVAELLRQWNAVEYFQDYITSTKKRRTLLFPMPRRRSMDKNLPSFVFARVYDTKLTQRS